MYGCRAVRPFKAQICMCIDVDALKILVYLCFFRHGHICLMQPPRPVINVVVFWFPPFIYGIKSAADGSDWAGLKFH